MSARRVRSRALITLAISASCTNSFADLCFWDGGGTNNSFSNPSNWVTNMFFHAPANDGTEDCIMQGTLRPTPFVDIDFDILSLQFSGGGGAGPFTFTAGGGDLSIRSGGVINNDTDLQIISQMSMGANHTWNAAAGPLRVNFMTLGGLTTGRTLTVAGGFDTIIPNIISGSTLTNSGSIIVNSTANFTLGDGITAQANSFTGPITVNGGTLILNKPSGTTSVPANLIIGDGVGNDVVKYFRDNQIADTSNVTVNSAGLFNLNGANESINNLAINGGSVTTSGGTLAVNGGLSMTGGTISASTGRLIAPALLVNPSANTAFVSGNLDLGAGTNTFTVHDGAAAQDLNLSGTLFGNDIVKNGAGQLAISAPLVDGSALPLNGTIHVQEGTIAIQHPSPLQSYTGLIVGDNVGVDVLSIQSGSFQFQADIEILGSGVVDLNGVQAQAQELTVWSGGRIQFEGGTFSTVYVTTGRVIQRGGGTFQIDGGTVVTGNWSTGAFETLPSTIAGTGTLMAADNLHFGISDTSAEVDLRVSVPIAGNLIPGARLLLGALADFAVTQVVFDGPEANTYPNLVMVVDGMTLTLGKSSIDGAIFSDLSMFGGVGFPAIVRLAANQQIRAVAGNEIAIQRFGLLDLNNFQEEIQDLKLIGGTVITGTGTLSVLGSLVFQAVAGQAATSTISGNLNLAATLKDFNVADGLAAVDLDVPAAIFNGSIVKTSSGTLRLSGDNSDVASVRLEGGRLRLAHQNALGPGTFQIAGGTIEADGVNRTIAVPTDVSGSFGVDGSLDITISGALNNSGGYAITKTGSGELRFTGQQDHGPGAAINVNGGDVEFTSDAGGPSASTNLVVNIDNAASSVDFVTTQHLAGFHGNAGVASIRPGGSNLLVAGALTVDATDARLDINEHAAIVEYSGATPLPTIQSWIFSGRNGGDWLGFGITSTAAAGSSIRGIGLLEGSDWINFTGSTTFEGETIDATTVLFKYTYNGDADLNEVIDFDDYVRIDSGFNAGLTGWINGDFDFNDVIDFDDYVLIDTAFNGQAGTLIDALNWLEGEDRSALNMSRPGVAIVAQHFEQFGIGYSNAFYASVPEPYTLTLLICSGILLTRRRA